MISSSKIFLLLLFTGSFISAMHTDSLSTYRICEKMIEEGFENVIVRVVDEDLAVTYENRVYRDEMRAIKKINAIIYSIISEDSSAFKNITLIPQNRNIPLVVISYTLIDLIHLENLKLPVQTFVQNLNVSFDTDEIWQMVQTFRFRNKSKNKLDIVLTPKFKTELDEFTDPVKLQIGIAPGLSMSLGNGSLLHGEYIIPIVHKDFRVGKPIDPFRPGIISFNQVLKLTENSFFSSSIGLFSENRYGFDAEYRCYFYNGILSLGANIGYTGEARYYEKQFNTTFIEDLTYYIDSEVRLPWYNMTCTLSYGQYIYDDRGFRFDINREFNEVNIGFFVTRTESSKLGRFDSGGFTVSVPIFPKEYCNPGAVRIVPDKYFSWEYNVFHFIYFHQKKYSTGNELKLFIKRLQPDYIKEQLRRIYSDE